MRIPSAPRYVLTSPSLAVTVALCTLDSVGHLPASGQLSIPIWQLQRSSICIMAGNDLCNIFCVAVADFDVLAVYAFF